MITGVHAVLFTEDADALRAFLGDDIERTAAELEAKGVELARPVTDEGFGLVSAIRPPGGGELGIYEPRHPSPLPPPTS
jgi:predicted enzyme related to lactoylglutathione lyase